MGESWGWKRWRRGRAHIFLHLRALFAIVGVGNADATTDDAAPLIRPVVALVTDARESGWPDIAVADDAQAVVCGGDPAERVRSAGKGECERAAARTFLAETTDGYARLLSAHYEVRMMLCHCCKAFYSSRETAAGLELIQTRSRGRHARSTCHLFL